MVLIKLSAHHKIAGIGTAILLVALLLVFATGAVLNNAGSAKNEPAGKAETSVTQYYETETRDECIEKTENITPTNTTATSANEEFVEEDLYIKHYTEQDAIDIAKVLYHECRGVPSKIEQACVAWTILNRVDCYDSTVYSVVRSPNQFAFYESTPVWGELLDLAHDVLDRWSREKDGEENVGRVLPKEYIYFEGRNGHNYFRDNYSGSYNLWDFFLDNPYES